MRRAQRPSSPRLSMNAPHTVTVQIRPTVSRNASTQGSKNTVRYTAKIEATRAWHRRCPVRAAQWLFVQVRPSSVVGSRRNSTARPGFTGLLSTLPGARRQRSAKLKQIFYPTTISYENVAIRARPADGTSGRSVGMRYVRGQQGGAETRPRLQVRRRLDGPIRCHLFAVV